MLNKNDYKILSILDENSCNSSLRSYTLKKIAEISGFSISKLRITIRLLKLMGYAKEGANSARSKTYYITELGKLKLEELTK